MLKSKTGYKYFSFTHKDGQINVLTLPSSYIIVDIILVIEQAFQPGSTSFNLKLLGRDNFSVAGGNIGTRQVFRPYTSGGSLNTQKDLLRVFDKEEQLIFTYMDTGSGLTAGYGWGLIEYMNMGLVDGYRRL